MPISISEKRKPWTQRRNIQEDDIEQNGDNNLLVYCYLLNIVYRWGYVLFGIFWRNWRQAFFRSFPLKPLHLDSIHTYYKEWIVSKCMHVYIWYGCDYLPYE